MKVLLLQAPFEGAHMISPPLGLGYLASVLENSDVKCVIKDAIKEKLSIKEITTCIKKEDPDLIGISFMSKSYTTVKKITKALSPLKKPIVLGGPHVTVFPKRVLKETHADLVIFGEGENTILELVDNSHKNYSKIKGLGYKDKYGKIKINEKREFIKNLDKIPFPAWHLMPPKNYPPTPQGTAARRFPIAPIITSRGCPFKCSFCTSNLIWRGKFRYRSAKNVVDEIELLVNNYGVKEIHFSDDNFTLIKKRVMEICDEIIKRRLDIVWACPNGVRVDSLNKKILRKMKKSGCYSLTFGIESGNQEILNSIHKKLDLRLVPKILKLTKDEGIETRGFFIIGFPGETVEMAKKTINYAKSLPLDMAGFFILSALPGSEIFTNYIKEKNINLDKFDWSLLDRFNKAKDMKISNMSPIQLSKIFISAHKQFYLRPNVILHFLRNLRLRQVKWIAKRTFRLFKVFN